MKMFCILIAGLPAAGKSTMAAELSRRLALPVFAKDDIKEVLFDTLGFTSRAEKVRLGEAAAAILNDCAVRLMKLGKPFMLENNFEDAARAPLMSLLEQYGYTGITLVLTGDRRKLYQRFCLRNISPKRHRGHVVNDRYPEAVPRTTEELRAATLSYEDYCRGIDRRGMERFCANGPCLRIDTTEFDAVDMDAVEAWIRAKAADLNE